MTDAPRGTLYVVGTPIGNLEDLSARAIEALGASDLVACEDTRRSRILLARHHLRPRLVSCHRFNETRRVPEIMRTLDRGGRVSLVSDGGTPGISDPGARLVSAARAAGHSIVPIPGPSAITALLSASGFEAGPFTFIGFLPHRKGERRRVLESLRSETRPLLFFESPLRIVATLQDTLEILGDRDAFLGREMTKVHEELLSGTLGGLRAVLEQRGPRGEIAFLVAGARCAASAGAPAPGAAAEDPGPRVRALIESGVDRKEAMRRVARESGLSRRDLYRRLLRDREEE